MYFLVVRTFEFYEILLVVLTGPTFYFLSQARIYSILSLAGGNETSYLKNSIWVAIVASFAIFGSILIDYRILVCYGVLLSLVGLKIFEYDFKKVGGN